jgi:hypothetical protein
MPEFVHLDIAKSVFQVHGVDAANRVVVREASPGSCVLSEAASSLGRH